MLPAIAVLHARGVGLRPSGAVLATIAGTATVAVGLAGSVNVDLQPAALLVLGMWWWTTGKMWAQTRLLARSLGLVTAALGAMAIAASLFAAFAVGITIISPGFPDVAVWTIVRAILGVWLVALALALWRDAAGARSNTMSS